MQARIYLPLFALGFVLGPLTATAQETEVQIAPDQVKYTRRLVVDFTALQVVGQIAKPDIHRTLVRARAGFVRMSWAKTHMVPELQASLSSMPD